MSACCNELKFDVSVVLISSVKINIVALYAPKQENSMTTISEAQKKAKEFKDSIEQFTDENEFREPVETLFIAVSCVTHGTCEKVY